jgi:hypothetical protein
VLFVICLLVGITQLSCVNTSTQEQLAYSFESNESNSNCLDTRSSSLPVISVSIVVIIILVHLLVNFMLLKRLIALSIDDIEQEGSPLDTWVATPSGNAPSSIGSTAAPAASQAISPGSAGQADRQPASDSSSSTPSGSVNPAGGVATHGEVLGEM